MKKSIVSMFYAVVLMLAFMLGGCGGEKKEAAPAATAEQPAAGSIWEQSTLNKILKSGVLRVGMEAGYMPFELKNKNGEIVGFDVELAKMMAEDMGVKLELVNTAWDGIIPALLTDKFDIIMSGMTITPQRNLQVNFCEPYIVVGQTIFIKKDLEGKVKSYADLNDPKYTIATKLGVTADYASKKYMGKANIRLFETEQEGAMEVLNGKADAFVYDLPYNAIFFAQNKDKLAFLDTPFTFEPLAWAIRKGDPDFSNFLNNYLAQIKGDGRYQAAYDKWFGSTEWLADIQ
ncbi:MAG: transporter substrate-binding domain-containing protein [Deferribacterales bacterium]